MKLIKSVVLGVDAAAAVSGFVRSTVWNGSAAAFNGVASRDALCPPFAAQKPSPSLTAPCKAASAGGGVRGRSLLFVQPIVLTRDYSISTSGEGSQAGTVNRRLAAVQGKQERKQIDRRSPAASVLCLRLTFVLSYFMSA